MQPFVVDSFLPDALYRALLAVAGSAPMEYGSKSNSETDPHGHWSWKPLYDSRYNLADLTGQISSRVLGETCEMITAALAERWELDSKYNYKRWCLIRCYLNAHTYGIDGYFHCDSERDGDLTAILYVCDKWHEDWAGETVWRSNAECVTGIKAVLPWPNRLLVIPSNINHCARAVSRKCNDLRRTMVFKLRPRYSEEFEKLSSWLMSLDALKLPHGKSSLHDHLMRCWLLIEGYGNMFPPHLRYAAALHSIYGTNAFTHRLLEPSSANRSMVSGRFGEKAEALAYMFSLLDRPATLERYKIVRGGADGEQIIRRLKMRYDQSVDVDPEMLLQLQMIECANLRDQNALDKWPNLAALWSEHTGRQ